MITATAMLLRLPYICQHNPRELSMVAPHAWLCADAAATLLWSSALCCYSSFCLASCCPLHADIAFNIFAAMSELDQFDRMINWMLLTYFGCLALGWGLLLFDWVWNKVHKLHSQVCVLHQTHITHQAASCMTAASYVTTMSRLRHVAVFSARLSVRILECRSHG